MPSLRWDVIVVGAGPAGSHAARLLALAGLEVLLLEKSRLPRRKPCGGAVSWKAVPLVARALEGLEREELTGLRVSLAGKEPLTAHRPRPYAVTVPRAAFDHRLARLAADAGAGLREECPVAGVREDREGVEVEVGGGRFWARAVVGADGALSPVRRSLGRPVRGLPMGLTVEIPRHRLDPGALPPPGTAVVDYGCVPRGYGWAFPRGGVVAAGVGSLGRRHLPLGRHLAQFLSRLYPGLSFDGLEAAAHPLPVWGRSFPGRGRVLLAGDAAGLLDPLSGEGIHAALESGGLAARAILERGPGRALEAYAAALSSLEAERRIAARLARWFYLFPTFFHHRFILTGSVTGRVLRVIAGEEKYSDLTRWGFRRLVGKCHQSSVSDKR